jgi:hypothetical protein
VRTGPPPVMQRSRVLRAYTIEAKYESLRRCRRANSLADACRGGQLDRGLSGCLAVAIAFTYTSLDVPRFLLACSKACHPLIGLASWHR